MSTLESTPPLHGIRILDLGHSMVSAVTTMLFADYGAEVIRVERPEGSVLRRTGGHSLWNRGKRSLVADLADPVAQATVRELARSADVIVEDHRPGKVAGWGLDHASVSVDNPDVVYCSISAYGQDDSRNARLGTDAAVIANLGLMVEWGGRREGPIFLGHPAIDYATALLASAGTLALLRARIVSGCGDFLDVSLLDGALSLYTMNWKSASGSSSINKKGADGSLRFGNKRLLLRLFDCKDGLIQIHTGAAGAFDRAMEVFGLGDEVTKQQGDVQMSSLLTDRDLEIIEARLPDIMKTRTVDEWLELLWSNQIAALPVHEPGEALNDGQVRHAGIVASLNDPALGPIELLGPSILFSDTPGAIDAPAPVLGHDGDDIRANGWRAEGLAAAADPTPLPGPMSGIRIVEFATFFAAPYADRLLSDLGADVVKVEAIEGDPMRPLPEYFEGANRGKRSIAANLKDPRAMAMVRALVDRADVVQHNLRPGAAERLGIDAATLRDGRPGLVYHYLPGYGSSGPKSKLQSFAPLLSGFVGVFANGAGLGNRPHQVFGNEDYYNGLLGASACLLGIISRERTGRGQTVESPQLHSSMFTTSEFFLRQGRIESAIPRLGSELYGWAAGYRIYQCLDAWVCVTCTHDREVVALADTVLSGERRGEIADAELTALAPETGTLAQLLEYHFVERLAAEWVDALAAAGVPAELVNDDPWLAASSWDDPELLARGAIRTLDHHEAGPVSAVGDFLRPLHQKASERRSSPRHGEHTRELLRELGNSDAEIEALVAERVVKAL